jgi:predicted RNA-binding Zn-ribbon protein involved in translation (DUF1610 family)
MKKVYLNSRTSEFTGYAREAMAWHRHGDTVQVNTLSDTGALINSVHVTGKQPELKPNENIAMCKSIANDLDDYVNGLVYRCPECGELIEVPETWTGEKYKCSNCNTVHDGDELEQQSLYDYFEDVLDIEYRIGSEKQYRSVQVMVTCGGPNIYIDTASGYVELYWWGDRASYPISTYAIEEIDQLFEELFNC